MKFPLRSLAFLGLVFGSIVSAVILFNHNSIVSQLNPAPRVVRPATALSTITLAENLVRVIRVIDGDTIEIGGGPGRSGEKVRYIGINAPESVDPRKPVQCFGLESSLADTELVEGKLVRLEKDISDRDKYGRLLRYVYLPQAGGSEIFINQKLVAEGFAEVDTFPPDVKYQKVFLATQANARAANRGLWSACK